MDAKKWAEEFVNLYPDFEEDVALGWFANAIMAGYDTAANKLTAENERLLRVVEQATQYMVIDGGTIMMRDSGGDLSFGVCLVANAPDLFAQLKGADRG